MKVNRTYSMDYDLVLQLAKKHNQSALVCRAVRKYIHDSDDFNVRDIPTRQLYAVLLSRGNVPQHLRVQLQLELNKS
jgi:hypothetical protein